MHSCELQSAKIGHRSEVIYNIKTLNGCSCEDIYDFTPRQQQRIAQPPPRLAVVDPGLQVLLKQLEALGDPPGPSDGGDAARQGPAGVKHPAVVRICLDD